MYFFHNTDEENAYMSNWYHVSFTVDGITYSSSEQYMMYQKALLFDDTETASKILDNDDPSTIKALGRMVAPFDEKVWSKHRYDIVYKGVFAKFYQNEDIRAMLISTGDEIIAECSVSDKVWGIGLSMSDPLRYDITKWPGQNLLGKILMAVRDQLNTH